ncbi:MAG: HAD family hydrolase [Okeania sp. SIO2G4]|uniref:HAD family hydrolase n=1 Tax=unclassified Okeania TaxID=2634635 RepID=UPI0013B8E456|nr:MULTISPECIES: HAD family hydrolase [unclassified Okeania]NEP06724.1 HAD family hydrolase [Okeania sp. SIO4D6]NEP41418.1 HAD family hydrolase [Okeania sp. SIO2H7]NEP74418.1 HAD family hydrolase [Okeania sp. SIO2G5]NEP95546.1 HAD family hydrolase [Okeania sp. SIO2F5]NEQ93259.1 HAD family hydrolase [Okeania sp. SIO2G4]
MVAINCRDVIFPDIQAIIFDKDGTLENSQEFLRNLGQKLARLIDAKIPGIGEPLLMSFGIDGQSLNPTGLMAVGSRRENEIAAAAYIAETGRGWLESLAIAKETFEEAEKIMEQSEPSPIFIGSLEVLKYLWEKGIKLGILSAASTKAVQNFVKYYQLKDYIQLEMGVDDSPSKPDPELFLQACQKLGVTPDKVLMVGDSPMDIEMAKKAGAAGCIGICWGKSEVNYLQGADVAIAHLEEIKVL